MCRHLGILLVAWVWSQAFQPAYNPSIKMATIFKAHKLTFQDKPPLFRDTEIQSAKSSMARIASVLQTQDRGKKNLALPAFQISCRWSREKNKANVVEDLEESLGKGLLSWASWYLQTFSGYFRTRLNPFFFAHSWCAECKCLVPAT